MESEQWESYNGCLLRLYQATDARRHAEVVLDVLVGLVPSDVSVYGVLRAGEPTQFFGRPEDSRADWARPLGPLNDCTLALDPPAPGPGDSGWSRELDRMSIEAFHGSVWYDHFVKPRGLQHQLGSVLGNFKGERHFVLLLRARQGFSEREKSLLNQIRAHLVNSILCDWKRRQRESALNILTTVMESAPGAYGCFDESGNVLWMQSRAQVWLMEFFPEETAWAGSVPLSIARLLRETATNKRGTARISRISEQDVLTACIERMPRGGWVLCLDRKAKVIPRRFQRLEQLSPRENHVMRWVVEGEAKQRDRPDPRIESEDG